MIAMQNVRKVRAHASLLKNIAERKIHGLDELTLSLLSCYE